MRTSSATEHSRIDIPDAAGPSDGAWVLSTVTLPGYVRFIEYVEIEIMDHSVFHDLVTELEFELTREAMPR